MNIAPEGLPLEPVVPEDERKKLWAGHITYTPHEAAVVGCRLVGIEAPGCDVYALAEDINAWARNNPDLRVVSIQYPSPDRATLLVVKRMGPEEVQELTELEEAWSAFLPQWRAKKNELKLKAEEARLKAEEELRALQIAEEKENARLIELGKQHEANCSKKKEKKA